MLIFFIHKISHIAWVLFELRNKKTNFQSQSLNERPVLMNVLMGFSEY